MRIQRNRLGANQCVLYNAASHWGMAHSELVCLRISHRVGTQSTFNVDLQSAKSLAETTLGEMIKYGVPPTPPNFCVWYNYAAKAIAGLTRDIDERIALQKGFGWQANQELFERYFGTDVETAAIRKTGSALNQTVGKVL